jgi:hypothetical protein
MDGGNMSYPYILDGVLDGVSADMIRDKLLLCDVSVPISEIARWTETQKTFAVNWAEASYLVASDNVLNDYCRAHDDSYKYDPPFRCICRPPKPEFLTRYESQGDLTK